MDCRSFHDRLEDFVDERLTTSDRRAADEHLQVCSSCREVAEIMLTASGAMPREASPDLTRAILERTSGSACESSRDLLCDFVDQSLASVNAELVRLHLDDCGECSALTGAIARLTEELPELAEIEPDTAFVDDVLGRTLPWQRRLARRFPALADFGKHMVRRPRFALEAAYVCTVVLVLAVGPRTLARVPEWVGRVKTPSTVELELTAEMRSRVASGLGELWGATGGRAAEVSREVRQGLSDRYERTGDARDELRRHRDELVEAAREIDPGTAVTAFKGIGSGLGTISRDFASDEIDEDENSER
jgi:predicted anti-sigma-YlaC factor YlaD